jgi:DNA-binding transcriptional MerR regulator
MKQMTIGRLSKAAGVKVTTIRYYESIDLMGEPERSTSGQRLYDDDAVQRLSFIRHARDLGFPIDSIRELIKLQHQPGEDCAHVDIIARRQLADVRQKLSQLEALEGELKRMISACEGGSIASCKVLESLGDHTLCLESHTAKAMLDKSAGMNK